MILRNCYCCYNMQLIHNKDYDDDDDYDDNVFVDNEVRMEEDKTVKGYRFSFSVSELKHI